MSASDVKLLGAWQSPYSVRVEMALKLKGIEYELVETDAYNKSELLVKMNPVHKKIPVLIHGGTPICESLVIVQYIDDAWANGIPILPSDPYDRSIARFWVACIDDKLVPSFKELKETKTNEARRKIINKMSEDLVLLEDTLVRCSQGKGYFGGDNIGYLDIVLGCYVGWMTTLETLMNLKYFDETKAPNLAAWAKRMYSDSTVEDVLPTTQKLLNFILQTRPTSNSE